jgi:hypothetical protein
MGRRDREVQTMIQRMTAEAARVALANATKPKGNKFRAERQYRCERCGEPFVKNQPDPEYSCGRPLIRAQERKPCRNFIIKFDSKAEAKHWAELRLREKIGEIADVQCQVPFDIIINGLNVGKYVADFDYVIKKPKWGPRVIEDVKGGNATDTPLSKFKRKCVEAQYGIKIEIVRMGCG